MKTTKLIILSAAILLAVQAKHKVVELDLDDPAYTAVKGNYSLSLDVDDRLRMVVNENPTTGYQWTYQDPEERNMTVFSIEHDQYKQDTYYYEKTGRQLTGVGGIRIIQLKAESNGTDTFEMVYVKPWEF